MAFDRESNDVLPSTIDLRARAHYFNPSYLALHFKQIQVTDFAVRLPGEVFCKSEVKLPSIPFLPL